MHGIVLFAHGSRDPEWAKPFEAIRDRIRTARPECPIALAYLELMSPTLEDAIAQVIAEGAAAIAVFPLFMAQGAHLRNDLPRIVAAIRESHAHVPIALESAAGEAPEILDALCAWVVDRTG